MGQTVSTQKKREVWLRPNPLFFLLTAAILAFLIKIQAGNSLNTTPVPTVGETVVALAGLARDYNQYSVVIEESGPGYNLQFSGHVTGSVIYGQLDQYDIEVFVRQGQYFVRDGDLFKQWQDADEAEMGGISDFVRDPQELLDVLLSGQEIDAGEGPDRIVGGVPCRTYSLEADLPAEGIFQELRIGAQRGAGKMQVHLWFGEEDNFLYRMALLLNFTEEDGIVHVSRVYTMSPCAVQLPDGLPYPDDRPVEI